LHEPLLAVKAAVTRSPVVAGVILERLRNALAVRAQGRAKAGDRAAAVTNTIELGLYFLNNMLSIRPASIVDDSVSPDSGMAGRSAAEKRQ